MGNLCITGGSRKSVTSLDESDSGGGGGSATPYSQHNLRETLKAAGDVAQRTPENANWPGFAHSSSPAGTPTRRFSWPLSPPSPASIPRENDDGRRGPGINFGYVNSFSLFELKRVLGRGHFGHTYKAKGLSGELKNQLVAVKIISKAQMTTLFAIEDVRREVNILRALSGHQNLIQFFDAFDDEQNVFIVMEYCEGDGLLDIFLSRGGRYKENDANKRVIVQILNVVAHIHLQGVVHRDLKSENFLFARKNEEAQSKVIDFALSDFIQPDECLNDVVGSAFYFAPEVLHMSYGVSIVHLEPNFQDRHWKNISRKGKNFVRRI